jgi:hypothetical protein
LECLLSSDAVAEVSQTRQSLTLAYVLLWVLNKLGRTMVSQEHTRVGRIPGCHNICELKTLIVLTGSSGLLVSPFNIYHLLNPFSFSSRPSHLRLSRSRSASSARAAISERTTTQSTHSPHASTTSSISVGSQRPSCSLHNQQSGFRIMDAVSWRQS